MKKVFCALGIVLLLASAAIAALPEPFEAARRIANGGECNSENVCVWSAQEPGDKDIVHLIIHNKQNQSVSLVTIDRANFVGVGITLINGKFVYEVVLFTPMGPALMEQVEMVEGEGLEFAFNFFRSLVTLNLI